MCQAAALTALDRRGFGIKVIVKGTIMGSDPFMSGCLGFWGFGRGAMGDQPRTQVEG